MPKTLAAQVEDLILLAKKYGLKTLKTDKVSFEFLSEVIKVEGDGYIPVTGEKMPSDDEMLYYSADSPIQVPKQ